MATLAWPDTGDAFLISQNQNQYKFAKQWNHCIAQRISPQEHCVFEPNCGSTER